MLTEQYRIGDRVVMKMDPEARGWGRKGVPDGTQGEVVALFQGSRYYGYQERRFHPVPGLYTFNGALKVRWDGTDDFDNLGGSEVRLVDKDEQTRRETEFAAMTQDGRNSVIAAYRDGQKIADLPETPFVPGDMVRDLNPNDPDRHLYNYRVLSIDYNFQFYGGSTDHLYNIEAIDIETGKRCFTTSRVGNNLELIERGNIWRELNGEPLVFKDIGEEASYATSMGRSTEVRNPSTGNYSWTKDEVLTAIQTGIVDAFSMPQMPFSMSRTIRAERFHDRDLGERVRFETLKGFDLVA